MFPQPSVLKQKLVAGECIYGLYIQTNSADSVEIAAVTGYDYVIIDGEHGSIGFSEIVNMIRAAEASGITPLVRVADHNPAAIRRMLEAGAMGIYVPQVETAAQAQSAIAAIRFKVGDNGAMRGTCPTVRATRGQGARWGDFVEWSNSNILAVLLVETQTGMRNLDEILAVPGIDTIVLGRFDLAHDLGLFGDRYGQTLSRMFDEFVSKAKAAGIPYVARISATEPEQMRAEHQSLVASGARVFNVSGDRDLMAKAFSAALTPLRDG